VSKLILKSDKEGGNYGFWHMMRVEDVHVDENNPFVPRRG
jgi:hypothetical protein